MVPMAHTRCAGNFTIIEPDNKNFYEKSTRNILLKKNKARLPDCWLVLKEENDRRAGRWCRERAALNLYELRHDTDQLPWVVRHCEVKIMRRITVSCGSHTSRELYGQRGEEKRVDCKVLRDVSLSARTGARCSRSRSPSGSSRNSEQSFLLSPLFLFLSGEKHAQAQAHPGTHPKSKQQTRLVKTERTSWQIVRFGEFAMMKPHTETPTQAHKMATHFFIVIPLLNVLFLSLKHHTHTEQRRSSLSLSSYSVRVQSLWKNWTVVVYVVRTL